MNRRARSWLRVSVPACLLAALAGCDERELLGPSTGPLAARAPKAPGSTNARPINSSTVHVAWDDSSTNEIGFRIERSATSAGPWETAGTTGKNVTSFDDGGRTSERQVCYRVLTLARSGESTPSNTSCTTPPAGPKNLRATALDHQAVELAWTDNSTVEEHYEVERATAEAGPYGGIALLAANTTSYRQNGLSTNTTYWYRVRPNKDGGYGDYSNVASATPALMPPRAPSGTSATPSVSHVAITWMDNATNEGGFRIERSVDAGSTWTTVRTLGPNATSAHDFQVARERNVCYRVFAFNTQGDSQPSDTDCTALPADPTDLVATAVDGAINLTWSDNSAVEGGYEVQRTDGITAYVVVAQLPVNSTSYRDGSVIRDVTYRYIVRATRDGGGSYYSNVASAVVATVPPAAPGGVQAIPWGSTAVGITWADNSTNEEGFRVERSTDAGASWATVRTSWFAAYYPDQFVDGGRTSEQQVCYRVFAYNSAGDSPPSETDCTTPPAAPTNLTATPVPEGVQLTWTDNSAVEDGYYVELITDCAEQPDYWILLPANSTSYLDTSGAWCFGPALAYYVVATKDGGWSDFSNEASTGPPAGAVGAAATSASKPVGRPSLRRRARVTDRTRPRRRRGRRRAGDAWLCVGKDAAGRHGRSHAHPAGSAARDVSPDHRAAARGARRPTRP
jgi:hypothetical protein